MGTEIELEVGDVSIAYAKNHTGIDFGYLFQPEDEQRCRSDAINYNYYEEHPEEREELTQLERAFVRPLSRVLPRLLLFGSNIESARFEYEAIVANAREIASFGSPKKEPDLLTFEEFCDLVCRHPLLSLAGGAEFDDDEKAKGRLLADNDFTRIPWSDNSDNFWSESSFFAAKVAILSAESMLHVFALNPKNLTAPVKWVFGPLVGAGWASRRDFEPGARRTQKILVATEGASDARIIKRALEVLRPDVADFFNFIDVDERHHFWGTGNLVKFAEGLLRVDIQNKVLFVFDNDAEGVEAYRKLSSLELPSNMRSMLLPELDEFCNFATRGPEGMGVSDINGRGAAIECYLDLNLPMYGPPQILWSNYKKDLDAWHGVLEFKSSYQRHFYGQSPDSLESGSYDVSKLLKLLDALIKEAALISSAV
ncbi:MAG: HEPN/Toprim-associated domain-containing protein [Pseudomonadota bacterium]